MDFENAEFGAFARVGAKRLAQAKGVTVEEAERDFDFVCYTIWRPFDRPVLQNPLAVTDARTVQGGDLQSVDNSATKKLSTMAFSRPERQRWYYFPQMQPEECLLFIGVKQPLCSACPHTAFVDPSVGPGTTKQRRSVDLRVMAAFP